MAELIIQKERKLENLRIIVEAWNIPKNEEFPHGIKYSYQAYDTETGQTLLRYDNHNRHAGSRDHKHIRQKTEKLSFTPENRRDLQKLFQKFMNELEELK